MSKPGILSIDIGTSSIRVSAYVKGKGIVKKYTISKSGAERFCIEELWDELSILIRKITNSCSEVNFEGIGVSAFLGWVVLSEKGKPVTEAWGWMAHGDEDEVNHFKSLLPSDTSKKIGRKVNSELGIFHWGKIIRNLSGRATVLSIKDYINYKLTGIYRMDRTHASYTGLFSIKTRNWDNELLDCYKLQSYSFPDIGDGHEEVGNITPWIANELALSEKTKVALCGPDGTLAILGGGGAESGKTIEVMGTTDVIYLVTREGDTDRIVDSGLVQNCHVVSNHYLIGGPTGMTGGTLTWLMEKWNWNFDSKEYHDMLKDWDKIRPADDGLFVIPSLTGARVPDWLPEMRGTVVGLSPNHTLAHLYKATVEGISFGTKRIIDQLKTITEIDRTLIAIGGGAKNETFLRTRAATSNVKVKIPLEIEASTVGVVALVGTLIGWYEDVSIAVEILNPIKHTIESTNFEKEYYEKHYRRYEKFTMKMKDWY